jgi:hypothetical protein
MILLILLISGCRTLEYPSVYAVPDFKVVPPSPPILQEIKTETAINDLVANLAKLDSYIQKLTIYYSFKDAYYQRIIDLINER